MDRQVFPIAVGRVKISSWRLDSRIARCFSLRWALLLSAAASRSPRNACLALSLLESKPMSLIASEQANSVLAMTELTSSLAVVDEASAPFLGQWNRLVSTTNWEKGRIIQEWRQALLAAAAPASEYADEAWSTRVGSVTGQHVGRLRRVYERFDGLRGDFPSLYWSHFQAALDWDDAEMWLEGAYQSGWSVADMRRERETTLGAVNADLPSEESTGADNAPAVATIPRPPQSGGSNSSRESDPDSRSAESDSAAPPFDDDAANDAPAEELRRPFANLAEMPDDFGEPYEALKLAIIRHKFARWQSIARDDVLAALDALRELALAPAEGA